MTPIIIRAATDSDAAALREVSAGAVAMLRRVYRPTPAAVEAKRARAAIRHCLIAQSGSSLLGYLEYEDRGSYFRLLGPMVDPAHQRQGVARALITRLIEIARAARVARLSLATIEQTGDVSIFEKLAFHVVSRSTPDDLISVTGTVLVEVEMQRLLT